MNRSCERWNCLSFTAFLLSAFLWIMQQFLLFVPFGIFLYSFGILFSFSLTWFAVALILVNIFALLIGLIYTFSDLSHLFATFRWPNLIFSDLGQRLYFFRWSDLHFLWSRSTLYPSFISSGLWQFLKFLGFIQKLLTSFLEVIS